MNHKYETDYYFASDMNDTDCEVVSKTFYRTHKEVEQK